MDAAEKCKQPKYTKVNLEIDCLVPVLAIHRRNPGYLPHTPNILMSTTTKGGIIYPLENQVFPNIASRYWSLGYDRTKRCPREPRGSHLGWLLMSSKEMEAIWANKRSACRAKRASGCLKLGMKGRPHFFRGSPL